MKNRSTKILAIALAVVTLALAACVGTLAWLYDKTEVETHTWTAGKVYITLTGDATPTFHIVPGKEEAYAPKITVHKDSEKAFVFIKVTENLGSLAGATDVFKTGAFKDYVEYSIDTSVWTALEGQDGVFYRVVDKANTNTELNIITDKKVTYNSGLQNEHLAPVQDIATGATQPGLTINSYAIQAEYQIDGADATPATAAQAWTLVQQQTDNTYPNVDIPVDQSTAP